MCTAWHGPHGTSRPASKRGQHGAEHMAGAGRSISQLTGQLAPVFLLFQWDKIP